MAGMPKGGGEDLMPQKFEPEPCTDPSTDEAHPCSAAEIAAQRAKWNDAQREQKSAKASEKEQGRKMMAAMMGGIDPGEDPWAACLRELHEETNVRSVSLLAEASDWYAYDLPNDVADKAWRGRYQGQRQKWFALRFEGQDDEIDIHTPGQGAHKPEFDAWRWEPMAHLPDLIIPFKRPVYEKVVADFAPFADRPA
jgi:8-oxo-dGTP pyrophosphatase MutT (NUDIX family)